MKHTPLYHQHVRDASILINLKGVARAVEYVGHRAEHRSVRERVGLCDVSHMGQIEFKGNDALVLVQKLITNDASKLSVNQALYSTMCQYNGGIIDDLVCFRVGVDHFIWVVNVTRIDEDYLWVQKQAVGMDVTVRNLSSDTALLALQGPESREALQRITQGDLSTLKYYWFMRTIVHTAHAEVPCIISRTGYTGERGYEIMLDRELAPWVWDELLMVGRPLGIVATGVAARESLRTEAGYLLNGNDMDADTNPLEAGLGWVVKFSKDFIGKEALARIAAAGIKRRLVGLEVEGRCTIRNGCGIYRNGAKIGRVTSGPLSQHLIGRNLGLGYVGVEYSDIDTEVEIDVRGKRAKGRVIALPFYRRRARDEPVIATYSPYDLRYSRAHVWSHMEDRQRRIVTLGLSDFGQRHLGDILSISLPKIGAKLTKEASAAWIDSYRKSFDIISPVNGEVVEVNEGLINLPAKINAYPYVRNGVLKVAITSVREYDDLMPFEQYAKLVQQLKGYDTWSADRRTT